MVKIKFTLNNKQQLLETDDSKRLIDVLREDLGLTGTKEGCGVGECGACTVIMNRKAVCSCLVLAGQMEGAVIETIENIKEDQVLAKLQKLFLENGAVQCGYCTPGMLMSTKALLDEVPNPTESQIKEALEGNLCRCTGYIPIMNAVKAAAAG
jgi:aerobic carbon-monoxide dehydrogenase small subunit